MQKEKGMTEDEMVGWHHWLNGWVLLGFRSWWWTWKPGVLPSMGSQRVGHDWATELNWTDWTARKSLQSTFNINFGSAGKESACNAGDLGSILRLGRSLEEGKGYPLQFSGLGNSKGYTVHEVAKSRTRLSLLKNCGVIHWRLASFVWIYSSQQIIRKLDRKKPQKYLS